MKYLIKLTVSVGWEKIQFGSLHPGQFLHLTFFNGILFSNTFFCSSGVILLKASTSIKFFFCSSVNSALLLFSPLFSSFSFPSFIPSWPPSWISLLSSVASFSVFCSPSGLLTLVVFFVGNFFLNLLKNYIIMRFFILFFFIFELFFWFRFYLRMDFKLNIFKNKKIFKFCPILLLIIINRNKKLKTQQKSNVRKNQK